MKHLMFALLLVAGSFAAVGHAETVCVGETEHGSGGALLTQCFSSFKDAQKYVHKELTPGDGSVALQPSDVSITDTSIQINYRNGEDGAVPSYWYSYYVGINPVKNFDCDSPAFGSTEGCATEGALWDFAYNYELDFGYKGSTIAFSGGYAGPPYVKYDTWFPSGFVGNKGLILVDSQKDRRYTITPPEAEDPADQLDPISGDVLKFDLYTCPETYSSHGDTWPNMCDSSPKRYLTIYTPDGYSCCDTEVADQEEKVTAPDDEFSQQPINAEANSYPSETSSIDLASGAEHYSEHLINWEGFVINLHYVSSSNMPFEYGLGPHWARSFSDRIFLSGTSIYSIDEKGAVDKYRAVNSTEYSATAMQGGIITKTAGDELANKGQWRLEKGDGRKYWFDDDGRLAEIESSVKTVNFEYCQEQDLAQQQCLQVGDLKNVVSSTGRRLRLYYQNISIAPPSGQADPASAIRLTDIKTADGTLLHFDYSSDGLLEKANYGESPYVEGRRYVYGDAAHLCKNWDNSDISGCDPSEFAEKLTEVIDPDGNSYKAFSYNGSGRTSRNEKGAGTEVIAAVSGYSQAAAVLPTGEVKTYSMSKQEGLFQKPTTITSTDFNGGDYGHVGRTYSGGHVTQEVDAEGNATRYEYDNKHLTSVTEGLDSNGNVQAESRSTNYSWDSNFNVPTEIVERDSQENIQHHIVQVVNSRGQISSACEIDDEIPGASDYTCGSSINAPGGIRQVNIVYCEQADVSNDVCPMVGLPMAVDGPRTDVSDITYYKYYQSDYQGCAANPQDCKYRKGDLWKVTKPSGMVTAYSAYDESGRILQKVDVNGIVRDLNYDERGRLIYIKARGPDSGSETDDAITHFEYDGEGNLSKTVSPAGVVVELGYDSAHRLTSLTDAYNNKSINVLDSAGAITSHQVVDAANNVITSISKLYDDIHRLEGLRDATNRPIYDYVHDNNQNIVRRTDGLGRVDTFTYDALGRLSKIVNDSGAGQINADIEIAHDVMGHISKVTDADLVVTSYLYDNLDNLTAVDSADAGLVTYGYDGAGNKISQHYASGDNATMSYDADNRLIEISVADGAQNVYVGYDTVNTGCGIDETFSAGHVVRVQDESGTTEFCYDRRGNVARKVQKSQNGLSLTVVAGHDLEGNMTDITYPSGVQVTYHRDLTGRIDSVAASLVGASAPIQIVSSAKYVPFGPITSLTYGNGRILSLTHDANGHIAEISDNEQDGLDISYDVDVMGEIGNITENSSTGGMVQRNYAYDDLQRLTDISDGMNSLLGYAYSAGGDRVSSSAGAVTTTNTVTAGTHQIESVGLIQRSYDSNGNTTAEGSRGYTYDAYNRLRTFMADGITASTKYIYNGMGQRVQKLNLTNDLLDITYVYNNAGHLLGEYDRNGVAIREYVWIDDILVAVIGDYNGSALQYVESDWLGAPRAVIQPATDAVIWRWSPSKNPFAFSGVNNDPDGDGNEYTLPIRYPGQYFDQESGLAYNFSRYYDPGLGRYLSPDHIGQAGGLNIYGYAGSNPLNSIDPNGNQLITLNEFKRPGYRIPRKDAIRIYGTGELAVAGALGGLSAVEYGGLLASMGVEVGSPACIEAAATAQKYSRQAALTVCITTGFCTGNKAGQYAADMQRIQQIAISASVSAKRWYRIIFPLK